jgi:hypothetical protein
MYRQNVV